MNVLLVAAGAAATWPVAGALGSVAGVRAVEVVLVPEPAGRGELDPVLDRLADRRLVLAGSAAAVGDVLTRLLRRDELGTTPVGAILQPGELETAARVAASGVPRPADLVRDDHGGVLVDRAELAPWTGRRLGMRAYVDDTRLADGEIAGLALVRTGDGAIRAEARPTRRRWRPGRTGAPAAGRAVQVSCAEARLIVDGREHPRPVTRRNWWVEPGRWLLVSPPAPAPAAAGAAGPGEGPGDAP